MGHATERCADQLHGLASGERVQLALAGAFWIAGAVVLGARGAGWLPAAPLALVLVAVGIAIGIAKARFLLDRVAQGVARRIYDRGPDAAVAGFLSVRSWVVVVIMIALGHALRLTSVPRPLLGVVYLAVATALTVASRTYWRILIGGWRELR